MFATLAASTAATIFSVSAALRPSGFSHITILPACAAAIAISACVSLGLAMSMRSMSLRSVSLRQSLSELSNPQFSAKSLALSGLRVATAFRTGSYSRLKKAPACRKALLWVRPMKPAPTRPMLSFFFVILLSR
jgi:hypothetical protein